MTQVSNQNAGQGGAQKTEDRALRRRIIGTVVSDKRNKTITVVWERSVRNARYGKIQKRHTRLHVHDEKEEANVGDVVEVMATRPISKTKNWRLVRIVRPAHGGVAAGAAAPVK
ncbi:MAG: 30S ribosomal protein S17 [Planctomycetes bacterium]|nr:30S ribosomal protein S17 [Planctomycetota bacterium]